MLLIGSRAQAATANTQVEQFERKSPFAISFLRLFAFSSPQAPIAPLTSTTVATTWLDEQEKDNVYSYRDELIAAALVDAWRGNKAEAELQLKLAISRYKLAPDPVLHFAIMQYDLEALRPLAVAWGQQLIALRPRDRWLRLSQGYLRQRTGATADAAEQFDAILSLPNQEPDHLQLLFKNWSWLALAELRKDSDPDLAKSYLRQAIESGMKGPTRESAQKALDSLEP